MLNLLLALTFSHFMVDFVIQNEEMVKNKNGTGLEKRKAQLHHALHFLGVSVILVYFNDLKGYSLKIIIGLCLLALSHAAIDNGKAAIIRKEKVNELIIFICDQLAHLLCIGVFVLYVEPHEVALQLNLFKNYLTGKAQYSVELTPLQQLLLLFNLVIVGTSFSNIFIRLLLKSLRITIARDSSDEIIKTGRYIGSLERVLTILGIYAGAYDAVVALYAAKTAIRFGRTQSDPIFAEYYFLGTSISAVIAIILGGLSKLLIRF